ncbi:GTP-binding protein [Clostridium boliviensis]|uniref:GTP-binding protein n=1 Tax=Clostridium boliviensis TaxID=318465 RepID=A0ABU4GM66_9CLOT|nr:GTP-binding protein [Clostridium boliviensis]MDW2798698.1 GTP-binding protein [Clostridium boliviensis]
MSRKINKKTPVILITGYLGSGKTTLLQGLLEGHDNSGLALIINDMGSVNIDGKLIMNEDSSQEAAKMVELQNGCICCSLREEFMNQIEELSKDQRVNKILVEASGISNPASIAEGFLMWEDDSGVYLHSVITVVDADRIYNEFLGEMEKQQDKEEEEEPDIINLVMDQIEFCSTIILNKCDLLPADKINQVINTIKQIQPEAEIIETTWGNVDSSLIFDGKEFDYDRVMNSSSLQKALAREKHMDESGTDGYGVSSFVYEERKPFDRQRFMLFLEENYPETVIRAKGYIWFSDDVVHAQLFEQAGRNASVSEATSWVAALPEDEKEEILRTYPDVLEDWDEIYGDRMNQIVFIGRDYNKEGMIMLLNSCIAEK